ncbi:APC family permease [Metallosphaera javensis (ex Sakai et al. 2022)]|uniref:APC family permease n=1 Tax=Metallosphaera javensis (ex Sakai et al. 2022) TaxID=2775498 RepID=UPI00258DC1A5|nr:MAG: amino acid-proton symporter related protein [Metallosphaera javensis (ex Sakai et al. 2022)]
METKNYLKATVLDNPNFRKSAGLLSMIAFSLGNIIGSGILLLPAVTASMAGGLTPMIWLAGGLLLLPLVLVYSQLAKMYPVVGSKVRFVNVTHGKVLASTVGWLYLIGTLFVVPIEAEASLQYLSYIFPSLWSNGSPTPLGYGVEVALVSVIYFLVYMGIRTQSVSVNVITYAKLGILTLYVGLVGILAFHSSNFSIPIQSKTSTLLEAIALTMFAYGGFRSAMVYAGESRNKDHTGKAILIAFLLSMAVYTLVSMVFIGSLTPSILGHGWGYVSKLTAPLT